MAALIVEFLFSLLRLIPQHRSAQIVETTISLNYTTMLNVIFLAIAGFSRAVFSNWWPENAGAHGLSS